MRWTRFVAAALCVVLAAVPAHAVVTGSIFGPGSVSFAIVIVPLTSAGGGAAASLAQQFARVLSRDLELSGYFRVLDPRTFVEDQQTAGVTADAIDFVSWASRSEEHTSELQSL